MAAVKALQQWCRVQCDGYRDVSVTNMTTSFRDGLAFCALIHRHRPDLIDFDSLRKENVYDNNKLAFKVAEDELGIPALLDAEDMVALKVPDRLSILTYVSQYYNYFHGRSPIGGMGGIKRPAESITNEPPGKKNQPVVSKMFTTSKPTRENSPPPPSNVTRPSSSPKPNRNPTQDVGKSIQTGTLSNKCTTCNQHVHLVQRHLVDGKLYHRNCAKSLSLNTSSALRDLSTNSYVSKFNPQPEPSKANTVTPANAVTAAHAPSKQGSAWLSKKADTPSNGSTAFSTPQHLSRPPYAAKESSSPFVSKPTASRDTTFTETGSKAFATSPSSQPASGLSSTTKEHPTPFVSKPSALHDSKFTTKSSNAFSSSPSSQPASGPAAAAKELPTPFHPTPFVSKPTALRDTTFTTKGSNIFSAAPSSQPKPSPTSAAKESPTAFVSKLAISQDTTTKGSNAFSTSSFLQPASRPNSAAKESPPAFQSKPTASHDTTFSTTITISPAPTAAPHTSPPTSVTAAKTRETKLKFLEPNTSKDDEKMKTTFSTGINKGQAVTGKRLEGIPGQPVTVVINVKDTDKGGAAAKTIPVGGRATTKQENVDSNKTKASAATFISKKLSEENNNNSSKPAWTNVALKKTEPQAQVETTKKETGGVRGRVRLRADPSILADLQPQEPQKPSFSPLGQKGLADRTPDRGGLHLDKTSPNTSVSENESPADWRSKLKPVSKETKPAGSSQSSPKPSANGATKTSVPSFMSSTSNTRIPATPAASRGLQNVQKDPVTNGTKAKTSKTKPGYIPREEIMKELQEIENNLNELEKTGIELEMKLRRSEEEGKDDSVMDELMVEWFSLIRNKQAAMRRESELVYIGRTQDLEEEQPSVVQDLRRLMEKPEHLKTAWDRQKEKQLMEKLLEIVNDRNAIVEGLDEDRLREEEEDEQLNKMMESFNIKKDKSKKKSSVLKLFGWGNKKEE
ncbi:MICAL-like protein 2 [Nematolebias whitei]|uniref:MICAL-like protein 2 n=1 Tax=Nematolebias whitei TaxID=451745 RepID=UPI0018989235|nr:MICAL-like protein 2 [Nematolebias whitei]